MVCLFSLLVAPTSPAMSTRPRVLGISHVAFRVSALAAARSFYEDFLGYRAAGGPELALIPVNERQYVELRAGLQPAEDRLDHVALQTDDVEAMRKHLGSRGVPVPERLTPDAAGNPSFSLRDPEGLGLEFVQHAREGLPTPLAAAAAGAISLRLLHAGVIVGDLEAATRFYGDGVGLIEVWRGSRSGTELSWTNMKAPDGSDYLEFMLYGERPAPGARGTQHHICLEVPDIEAARSRLAARVQATGYSRPLEARVGTNRKRQLNLFDPDGTRVELMEPGTVDGQPVPSSTAPPPRPQRSVAVTFDDLPAPGGGVVSTEVAVLRDLTAYALADSYVGRGGISWLHHWELSAGKKRSPSPDPPEWIMKAYAALP